MEYIRVSGKRPSLYSVVHTYVIYVLLDFSEKIPVLSEKSTHGDFFFVHLSRRLRERNGRCWGVVAYSMAQLVSAERLFARGAVEVSITPSPPPLFYP